MKMEYQNGVRTTPLPHELSPLDAAIERYATKAREYYDAQSKSSASLTKQQRDEKLKDALKHLEHERRHAENIVSVQAQLEEYRAFGRANKNAAGRSTLGAEAHHPTAQLAKYMKADGKPMPSPKHTPHHIVPGRGKTKSAGLARIHIHRFGVRINDPDNGVWLVRKKADTPHWSMPQSKSHLTIHTYNYETWVLQSVRANRNEKDVRNKLNILGRMLQQGAQPKEVTLPPDDNWNGQ